MRMTDSKAISQFFKQALAGNNVLLKSDGKQFYSYIYVADAVIGLLTILLKGHSANAYNVSSSSSNIQLRDLAKLIAAQKNVKVSITRPDATESAGFSRATKALLDSNKIRGIGWEARYSIKDGVARTFKILNELQNKTS